MKLSRETALELRKFLGSVEVVLARYAGSDPEARRLYRELSAEESGRVPSRMIYLSAGDETRDVRSDLDVGGHHVTRYDGGPENCLRCTVALLAAGDPTPEMPPGSFARSALHEATQRYILANPGTNYLKALNRVLDAGGVEP
jgi:hypothetical protein